MKLVSRKNDCVCASSSLGCGCHWPSVRRHLSVVLTPSITLIVYCVDGVHNSPYFLAVWLFGRVDGTRCTHKETRRSKTTGMNVKQQLQQQSTRNRGVRVKSKHVHVSIKGPEKKRREIEDQSILLFVTPHVPNRRHKPLSTCSSFHLHRCLFSLNISSTTSVNFK